MHKLFLPLIAITLLTFTPSCKKDKGPTEAQKKAVISNYSAIVYANYSDALTRAQELKIKVDAFVANPSQAGLDEARDAWKAARLPYGQTEVYRFSAGPIDDDNGPEGLLNSWPLDEKFIDYVQGQPNVGLINDVTNVPVLSKSVIEAMNEQAGETNISCGYHAIEFMLWGQDFNAAGPGNRPYTDFVSGGTAANQARRAQYLQICTDLIIDHLQYLVDAWAPNGSNYRHDFENGNTDQALTKILQGMGSLAKGELAGERLEVAYDTQLQEDEHSCFSDNTTNDVRMNMLGIMNVFMGTYTRIDGSTITGTGIYELIKAKDEDLGEELEEDDIDGCMDACNDILAPFDQQILASNPTGRQTVKTAIDRLKVLGDKLSLAAQKLGLTIVVQ